MHTINPAFKTTQRIDDGVDTHRGFIMVHIPKTGGTSIRKALEMPGIGTHAKWHQYRDLVGQKQYNKLFKFCFVRNPWSRFYSFYHYVRKEETYYHSAIHPAKSIYGKHRSYDLLKLASFNEAVHYLVEGRLLPYTNRFFLMAPQYLWCYDDQLNCQVDLVGRYESIETGYSSICERLGVEYKPLPRLNTSARQDDYKSMDPESRHLLGIYYEKDVDLFKYTF